MQDKINLVTNITVLTFGLSDRIIAEVVPLEAQSSTSNGLQTQRGQAIPVYIRGRCCCHGDEVKVIDVILMTKSILRGTVELQWLKH